MWLPDVLRRPDAVRIGAQGVELWRNVPEGATLLGRVSLSQRTSLYDAAQIVEPIATLIQQGESATVTLVLESTLLPAVLADTGGILTKRLQLEALLRHRLEATYGGLDVDVGSWRIRSDYRFGERYALGFAMPPSVAGALTDLGRVCRTSVRGWMPAFAWTFRRLRRARHWPSGWWGSIEQDRMLLARVAQGRFCSLHPAIELPSTLVDVQVAVDQERRRNGLCDEALPLTIGRWERQAESITADAGSCYLSIESLTSTVMRDQQGGMVQAAV